MRNAKSPMATRHHFLNTAIHLHRSAGEVYAKRIALMIAGLKSTNSAPYAKEAIRSLIGKIVSSPDEHPRA